MQNSLEVAHRATRNVIFETQLHQTNKCTVRPVCNPYDKTVSTILIL